ncbi:MAG: ATP-binding cassette, subfamily bacterial MsbA [Chloroflexota bacterium]|jgi:subfamily B ATP-binding cassette protein MsbA|nr:ATP-binding cassette, subfamily bacterial MsbA [Chloroflexota bacterium]
MMMRPGSGGGAHGFVMMGGGGQPKKKPSIAMYRRLLRFVRPYRRNLALAAALLVLSTILGLVWPQVVLRVLDLGLKDAALLDTLVVGLIAVLLVRAAIDGVRGYVMTWTGERVIFDLRMEIVRHLQSLSLSFFTRRKTGELMSHVTSDATLVHGVITQTIISVLGQVMTLVGGLVVIFLMNWRLALLTLVVAPPIGLLGQFLGRRIRTISREAQDAQGEAVGVLQEAIAEVRTVQAFTREDYESERFRSKLLITLAKVLERARLSSTLFPLIGFLGFAASIVVLWYGGHQVIRGEATTGQLVAFLLYAGMVAGPVGALASQWTQVQEAFGAADRIFALLDTAPEIQDRPGATDLPAANGRIVFEGVSFRYAQGPVVLADVSTMFEAGKTTALVGPSGAGKTTLVSLVSRFYDPTDGRITLDGHDLRDLTVRSLRGQIAVVPQEPILFATTVGDNIRYGRLDATDAQVRAAADAANATEFIDRLAERYETIVGERGVKLSVGQRQRIAIARALLRDSPVLLLDEATSSLDNESEYLVQEALARLMLGRTTIVIAHRLTTVERADRILVLERGRIVEDGTHQSLMAAHALYWRLYTRAFRPDDGLPAEPAGDGLPIVVGMDPGGQAHRDKVGERIGA